MKPRVRVQSRPKKAAAPVTPAPAPPAKKRPKYAFSTTSLTPGIKPLRPAHEDLTPPTVYYSAIAKEKIDLAVEYCAKEVGGWGIVEKVYDTDGNHVGYSVEDVWIPEQEVTATETEIEADALADLAAMLMGEGHDPSKLYFWFHSHVNMGVSPSGQDEYQVADYLENCPVFIRAIYNKKGESKVDVYDTEKGVAFESVRTMRWPTMTIEDRKAFLAAIDEKVTERVYTHRPYSGANTSVGHRVRQSSLFAPALDNDVPSWLEDEFDDEDDLSLDTDPYKLYGGH